MNRSERNAIRKAFSAFHGVLEFEVQRLKALLDETEATQLERAENLPDGLNGSALASDLEEAAELLSDAAQGLDALVETLDSIIEDLGISIHDRRLSKDESRPVLLKSGSEKRCERFNAVFTAKEMNGLKILSKTTGESMNGIICRLVDRELSSST